jgi:hypothetical protein
MRIRLIDIDSKIPNLALYLIVPEYDDVVWSVLEGAGYERPA